MNTRVHEVVIGHVHQHLSYQILALTEKLRANGENPEAMREIKAIKDTASAKVRVLNEHGAYDQLGPDASWSPSLKCRYPSLVLEVAHSESERHVRTKALKYFCGTDGAIRHVLVLKVTPPHRSLKGWLWLSQPVKTAEGTLKAVEVIQRKAFIPEDKNLSALPLKLGYFLSTDTSLPQHLRDIEISLPLLELPEVVAAAARLDAQDKAEDSLLRRNKNPPSYPRPRIDPQKSNFTTWTHPRSIAVQPILRGSIIRGFRWLARRR
ncbi:MAG: hypothetical protein Q9211_001102 [Gyalolechia sp. 1 TL-2023]